MKNALVVSGIQTPVPQPVAAAGEGAIRRFIEFFTANTRNRNTRSAYARAVADFFRWCQAVGLVELERLEPVHVAAYVEQLGQSRSATSVKQHLAARAYAVCLTQPNERRQARGPMCVKAEHGQAVEPSGADASSGNYRSTVAVLTAIRGETRLPCSSRSRNF